MGEDGEKIGPVEYLIETFRDMPRDYVNFDVYEKKVSDEYYIPEKGDYTW